MRPDRFHVIANLGHCADGRTRGADGVPLFQRNGGRNALDRIDLRFVHAIEELARVRRKRFDIAALAFGVEGIEGEGAFARTAQAGDDDQLIGREVEIEVLEVVMANSTQANDRIFL